MNEPIKITKKLCSTCQHSMRFSGMSNSIIKTGIACNYIQDTNHSRIFDENGNMRYPANYCDKYEPKTSVRNKRPTTIKRKGKK